MWSKIVHFLLRPHWVVILVSEEDSQDFTPGELAIRIWGVNFSYYKWNDPTPTLGKWRFAQKREFGEVIYSERN